MAATDAGVRAPSDRRRADSRDGRFVRRLHGELGGRPQPTGSMPSSPTPACGALESVRRDHRRVVLLAAGDDAEHGRRRIRRTAPSARSAPPMLVIHGDKDYSRTDRRGVAAVVRVADRVRPSPQGRTAPAPHRFLYFPSENHWVLTPQHAKIWYQGGDRIPWPVTCWVRTSSCPEALG